MGLLERIQDRRAGQIAEQRVIGGVPWRPWDSPYFKFSQGGPVHPARAFYGTDKALGLPALYSCVRLLSESLASLPLKIYIQAPGGTPSSRWNGPSFFDHPAAYGTVYDWLFQAMTALLLHGNAWGLITGRDGYGYPTGIEWIPPDMVTVEDDPQQPWNTLRTRVYVYGRAVPDWREELFHVKAFALPGRTEGVSPLRAFAMTVLAGMEAQRYGTDWFAAGGFPPGTFQNTSLEIDADQANALRESLTAAIRNRQPLVYGADWDYKPVVVPPSEAQFIETMQMNATQLAAVYGLPPDRVGGRRGDSLTYNTVEQSTLQVIEALRPWIVRLETAFFDLLPANRYCRFNADALLKTDLETRTKIYAQQRAIGLRNIDEMRDLEDLEPLDGKAGGENIPLEVMVAMARSTRGIPNTMLPQITLEMDLAADRIGKLEKEHPDLAAPAGPGSAQLQSPTNMLSRLISAGRKMEDLSAEDVLLLLEELAERDRDAQAAGMRASSSVILASLMQIFEKREGREKAAKLLKNAMDEADRPEFIGPWIPEPDDFSRLAAVYSGNGSNGNGKGPH